MSLLRAAQPGECDVWQIAWPIGGRADALQSRLDLALQMHQSRVRTDACPKRRRTLAAEFADAMKRQRERRCFDRGERIVHGLRLTTVGLPDETQCQVQLLAGLPARTWYAGLQA